MIIGHGAHRAALFCILREGDQCQNQNRGNDGCKNIQIIDEKAVIKYIISGFIYPDVDEIFKRASKIDKKISVATVYRTVKLLEEHGIIDKHDFKAGKARYEVSTENHHDHLIDVNSGEIIEFVDDEIEQLKKKIANRLGYDLIDHRLELYCKKK